MGEIFRSAFTESHLINADTVSVVANQIIKLGEYKVEAGEQLTIGFGDQGGQVNSNGRLYMSLQSDAAAQLHGLVRISVYSPQNRPLRILGEYRTETLLSGANDVTHRVALPENEIWLSEDKKLVLEFIADTSATLSKTNSDILMDMTVEAV